MTMGLFLIIIYFQRSPIYNVVDNNGKGGNIHPMTIFFYLLNIVDEDDF